jgi:hypothetical protein
MLVPPPIAETASHLSALQIRVAREHGAMAARGEADRGSFEHILRAWCRFNPALRGGSVALLVHLFDDAWDREAQRLELAAYAVRTALWPMFEHRAPRAAIIAAAERVNEDGLPPDFLEAVIADTCERATRRRRRA